MASRKNSCSLSRSPELLRSRSSALDKGNRCDLIQNSVRTVSVSMSMMKAMRNVFDLRGPKVKIQPH